MTMTAYAIRRKSDGLLLRARKDTRRGSSWASFEPTFRDTKLPWLWDTQAGAKRALAWWAKNRHNREKQYFKMTTNETKVFKTGYEVVTVTLSY